MSQNAPLPKSYQYLSSWNPSDITQAPPIQVVTCFLQKNDRFLVLQRSKKDQQYKLWGIPGGKLEKNESPLPGLVRELYEELNVTFSPDLFHPLGTALSHTPSDGQYGLYLYHALVSDPFNIQINLDEHYAFRWVTIDEFQMLDLLTAQREAFLLVQEQLVNLLHLTNPGGSNDKSTFSTT